ncbi:hypothetical protein GLV83_01040 [Staphylococcus hyicus]|nr:hypothetical protein [Staphylococcus hyicus]NJI30276.1 hypothetical protein [Staphylococcus hyicus]
MVIQEEYKIDISQTNGSSEETSAISLISYKIENTKHHTKGKDINIYR